jgi:hypothetical protein
MLYKELVKKFKNKRLKDLNKLLEDLKSLRDMDKLVEAPESVYAEFSVKTYNLKDGTPLELQEDISKGMEILSEKNIKADYINPIELEYDPDVELETDETIISSINPYLVRSYFILFTEDELIERFNRSEYKTEFMKYVKDWVIYEKDSDENTFFRIDCKILQLFKDEVLSPEQFVQITTSNCSV